MALADTEIAASWTNWSGHLTCSPAALHRPESLEELSVLVAEASKIRIAGSGHSFTELVPTNSELVLLERLSGVLNADADRRRARVAAGTTIHDLGPVLAGRGLALANQGDIDEQAMAGAIATGTHGTGLEFGCIASGVRGFQLVTATGNVLEVDEARHPELLQAAPVSLGALGVFAEFEIACAPRYNLRERVWVQPLREVLESWSDLVAQHDHFEWFTFPFTGLAMCKSLDREPFTPVPSDDATAADSSGGGYTQLLELNRNDPAQAREIFTGVLTKADPTTDFGPSHQIFPSDRTDRFNEMEYALPLDQGVTALRELVAAIEAADLPVLFPFEFRTVQADELWLSPFYQRDSAVIAVHQDAALDFRPVFEVAEPILRRHGGRPHWGKLHSLGPDDLSDLYPRWSDFLELRSELDPHGKFLNPYLASLLGVGA